MEDNIKIIILGIAGAITIVVPTILAIRTIGLKNMKYVKPEDSE